MKILISGGGGYIGSTLASACIDSGITPLILDNLSTGQRRFTEGRIFYEGDVGDRNLVRRVFKDHSDIYCVVHCAALTSVPESLKRPLDYYRVNLAETIKFVGEITDLGCDRVVFSSTAAIQGSVSDISNRSRPSNPYASSKSMAEQFLADVSSSGLRSIVMRYYNVVGADPKLRSGNTVDISSTHVIAQMLACRKFGWDFPVYGNDWPTRDGTAIRDFIHVWDLAIAHIQALSRFDDIMNHGSTDHEVMNIGTGVGTTVMELLASFERVAGCNLNVRIASRRPGDIGISTADIDHTRHLLQWDPVYSLEEAISSSLAWEEKGRSLAD
ncbi:UDP-glucose 4-epimerase GalE [Nocardia sp. CC227C]|uniref:UDP-glucose 4-epimerase GalE n=1 Tax=Nocardia sp. CC227C TaxID=3044562 RepID=UPI00278C5CCF|nr:UDP-glucose 4-epimerase GalE [Nocardia sp. CC227C]